MRIISGKYKGRRLTSFQAGHLRPTTDRVKESLFNKLAQEVPGAKVLDLFAGTGNLGLEALSRGASGVTFVELSSKSQAILQRNIQLLDLSDREMLRVVKNDVFKFIRRFQGEPFDLIFVDPPFTEKLAHSVMEAISSSSLLKTGGTLVIESGLRESIGDKYPPYYILDRRYFGDKTLSFFVLALEDEGTDVSLSSGSIDEVTSHEP